MPGVKLLLEAGADVNFQCMQSGGEYNSGQWGRRGKDGSMKALRKAKDRTALHLAIEAFMEFRAEGWADAMLKLLLQSNAGGSAPRVRARRSSSRPQRHASPLVAQSHCRRSPMPARRLSPMPARTDPNVRDVENRSALHLALDFDGDRGGVDLELAEVRYPSGGS